MSRYLLILTLVLVLFPAWTTGAQAETANELYVRAYQLENVDPAAAIGTYRRILEEWPTSEVAVKAIDRIEHLEEGLTGDGSPDELLAPEVTFRTDRGDIVAELFPGEAPQGVGALQTMVADGLLDGRTIQSFGRGALLTLPTKSVIDDNGLQPIEGTVWLLNSDEGTQLGISTADIPPHESLAVIGRVVDGLEVVEQLRESKVEIEEVDRSVGVENVDVDGNDVMLETGAGTIVFTLYNDEDRDSPVWDLRRSLSLWHVKPEENRLAPQQHPPISVYISLPWKNLMDRSFTRMLGDALTMDERRRATNLHSRLKLQRGNVVLIQNHSTSLGFLGFWTEDQPEYSGRTIPNPLWFTVGRVREGMDVVDEISAKAHLQDRRTVLPPVTATIESAALDLKNTRPAQEVAPECAAPEVLDTAREVVFDLLWENSAPGRAFAALAGGEPAQKEDIDRFTIESIRTVHTYPNQRGRSCRANVYRWILSRRQLIPAEYEVELVDNQPGRFNVYLVMDFGAASFVN